MKKRRQRHLHLHVKYYEEVEYDYLFQGARRVTKYRCSCGDEQVFKAVEEGQFSMPKKVRITPAILPTS